jgi:hypothetical protein
MSSELFRAMPLAVGRTFNDQPPTRSVAQEQLIDGDIQRRDFRRIDRNQRIWRILVSLNRRVRRRQFHVLQIDHAIGTPLASGILAEPFAC